MFYFKPYHLAETHASPLTIAFSSEKVISSELKDKYAQIKHRLQVKTVQNSSKQIQHVGGFYVRGQQGISLEEALLWIMGTYFVQKLQFEVKMPKL